MVSPGNGIDILVGPPQGPRDRGCHPLWRGRGLLVLTHKPAEVLADRAAAYPGLEQDDLTDVDPVLRHFGPRKELARERFREFVAAGAGLEYPGGLDLGVEAGILGSEDFVDSMIRRIGDTPRRRSEQMGRPERSFDATLLISAVKAIFGLSDDTFCGPEKTRKAVLANEVLILVGREQGAGVSELSLISGLDTSNVSPRCDAARRKLHTDRKLAFAKAQVEKIYLSNIAESQT